MGGQRPEPSNYHPNLQFLYKADLVYYLAHKNPRTENDELTIKSFMNQMKDEGFYNETIVQQINEYLDNPQNNQFPDIYFMLIDPVRNAILEWV